MIYTVTVSPAIDYVVHMDQFKKGMTNRSTGEEYYFGGKGINVSTILHNLGIENTALGFVSGFTGAALEAGLKAEGIKTDFIGLDEGITRINIKIKSDQETEINTQGATADEKALSRLFRQTESIVEGDTLIISGNIPDTLPEDTYEQILHRVYKKNIRIIVDATGDLLVNALKYRPFLIKPNKKELEDVFGTVCDSDEEIISYAKKLQDKGAKNVLVSLGKQGAILITETGETHKAGILNKKAVNTVGAGDSMVAGFLAGYMKSGDYEYALCLGSAAGIATSCSPGLASGEMIKKYFDEIRKVGK